MNPLPLIERELRVGARRVGSYRTRFFAALSLLLVWLILLLSDHRASLSQRSFHLFIALSVLAMGFALLSGVFLTADCLSEEKREGTLGLLFLTDLKGYDVVLGKLLATSLQSFYGLLAIFPVLALPLMMGGVTGGEFWRIILVLLVTIFLSLSLGLFVSALAREARQAMGAVFFGILLLAGILPAIYWLQIGLARRVYFIEVLWPSPTHAFRSALDYCYAFPTGPREFWRSIGLISLLSFTLLALATFILPRVWQDKPKRTRQPSAQLNPRSRFNKWRLEENPYFWLASRGSSIYRNGGLAFLVLLVVWFVALLSIFVRPTMAMPPTGFIVTMFTSYVLHLVFKFMLASEATRQLNSDKLSGALELLLVTPVPEWQILQGQARALRNRFAGLFLLLLMVNFVLCGVIFFLREKLHMSDKDQMIFIELFIGGILMLFLDFKALSTVGMLVALRAKRHTRAVIGAIWLVMFIPWAAVFLLIFLAQAGRFLNGPGSAAVVFAVWFSIGIAADVVLIAIASENLSRGLRRCMESPRSSFLAPAPLIYPTTYKPLNA